MKKFNVLLFIMLCLSFTECDKQLDLAQLGQLDERTYYQTEKDFEAASYSPYSALLNLYYSQDGLGWYNGILYPDDDIVPANNAPNNKEDFIWTPSDGDFGFLWQTFYTGIQRANVIIAKLPEAKGFAVEANKLKFEGEAKFLRAYFHFLLAINFGNAPVSDSFIGTIEETRKPNSKPGEIWDLIISDLKFAQANLPQSYGAEGLGRATSGSATALLGKVYLYRAQWDNNAVLYANAVAELSSLQGKYSLISTYGDNFNVNSENNPESIFEIQFTRGDFNTWLPTDFALYEDQNIGHAGTCRSVVWRPSCFNGNCAPGATSSGYGNMHITLPLQNEFEPNDPRRPETIYKNGDPFIGAVNFSAAWSVTGSTPAKYIKQDDLSDKFPPNYSLDNDRIIRYSDVLLMLAEAKLLGNNDVAGAAALINQVRRRADPGGLILPDRATSSTKTQMFKFLMHERRIELALEGHRYFDLVRWHRAGLINIKTDVDFGRGAANSNWSEKNLIKPIPQRELDLDKNLHQNPEYAGNG
jgi:hypothetical protein